MLLEAAALRAQAISVLYPEAGVEAMFAEQGQTQFPLVELGCSALAKDPDSLLSLLSSALTGSLNQLPKQEMNIRVDGQNARRAAGEIMKLLR